MDAYLARVRRILKALMNYAWQELRSAESLGGFMAGFDRCRDDEFLGGFMPGCGEIYRLCFLERSPILMVPRKQRNPVAKKNRPPRQRRPVIIQAQSPVPKLMLSDA